MTSIFLDTLPYIDLDYDEESMKKYVDSLIHEEMSKMSNTHLFPTSSFEFSSSSLLKNEYERFKRGEKADITHNSSISDDSLIEKIKRIESALESERVRSVNLDLSMKYGQDALKYHSRYLNNITKRELKHLEHVEEDQKRVNKERKMEQLKAGTNLQSMEIQINNCLETIKALQNK